MDLKAAYLIENENAISLNKQIPTEPKIKNHLRFVSWNIHYFSDVFEDDKFDSITDEIASMNADVIGLQEVVYFPGLIAKLKKKLGSDIQIRFCKAADWSVRDYGGVFGNLMISKRPIVSYWEQQLTPFNGEGRCAQFMQIETEAGKTITATNLHLDVFDPTGEIRKTQIDQLAMASANKKVVNQVVFGDFNALNRKEISKSQQKRIELSNQVRGIKTAYHEIETLKEYGYKDSFLHNNLVAPVSTCWTGRRVDYFFFPENSELQVSGIYIHSSVNSDHKAIIHDLGF